LKPFEYSPYRCCLLITQVEKLAIVGIRNALLLKHLVDNSFYCPSPVHAADINTHNGLRSNREYILPAASAAAPATSPPLASLLVDAGTLLADGIRLDSMALIGCHEPDAAVAVLGGSG
jgi:hypothetical protein